MADHYNVREELFGTLNNQRTPHGNQLENLVYNGGGVQF
jgi:hypothetical protein